MLFRSNDIVESLGYYKVLKLQATSSDTQYTDLAEVIFKMRYLKVDLYIPFAMSVLRYRIAGHIDNNQLTEIFKLIEIYFSRRIVCGILATSVDRFMSALHKDVTRYLASNQESSYVEILKYILLNRIGQTRLPDDSEYEREIRTREAYRMSNSYLIYVLSAAETKSKEKYSTTLHDVSNGHKLTIEHIMPQTITGKDVEWQNMLGEDYERIHDRYLHTFANLTLTGYNSEYSNLPYTGFPGKDKMTLITRNKKTGQLEEVGFRYSPLEVNEWISRQEVWNENTLIKRQNYWVESLNKIWPLPTSAFQPKTIDSSIDLLEDEDLTGVSIKSVEVFGVKTSVSSWAEAIDAISEALYDRYPNFIEAINDNEYLSKYIRKDGSSFSHGMEILDTGYFIETTTNTNTKLRLLRAYGSLFNLASGDLKGSIDSPESGEVSERFEKYIGWINEFDLEYVHIDIPGSVPRYIRITTDILEQLIPPRAEKNGGWKNGRAYYYELYYDKNGWAKIQLAFNLDNSTDLEVMGFNKVYSAVNKYPGARDKHWVVPQSWRLVNNKGDDELKESIRKVLKEEIPQFEMLISST